MQSQALLFIRIYEDIQRGHHEYVNHDDAVCHDALLDGVVHDVNVYLVPPSHGSDVNKKCDYVEFVYNLPLEQPEEDYKPAKKMFLI